MRNTLRRTGGVLAATVMGGALLALAPSAQAASYSAPVGASAEGPRCTLVRHDAVNYEVRNESSEPSLCEVQRLDGSPSHRLCVAPHSAVPQTGLSSMNPETYAVYVGTCRP
ncbi:hypothetical protein [Streptomyces sp. 3N207]|uniref:hypothetical protein n=1 Tax=Streptomyces sp. 3N207 TaxID=3457417 RepID=UPI003FCFD16D